jgi:DNA-directed RNA polymerase specialized sigma24 family protein
MSAKRSFPSTHNSLLAKLRERESEAWALFFRRYQGIILGWCRRKGLPASDSDDLLQCFMSDAPRKLQSYQWVNADGEPNRFRAWLKTIIDRKVADFRRDARLRTADYAFGGTEMPTRLTRLIDLTESREMAEELASAYERDIADVVARVRQRVRTETWIAFERYELLGESAQDTARILGKTVGAVYLAVHRINRMLAEIGRELFSSDTIDDTCGGHDEAMPERENTGPIHP